MMNEKKEIVMMELYHAVKEAQHRTQIEDDLGKQWLLKYSPNVEVTAVIKELTVVMLHVLEAIGKLEPVNGITISKQFDISRGSISKVTKKLEELTLIVIESLPGNKKELYFRTTALGKEVCRLHAALHAEMDANVYQFLQQYETNYLEMALKMVKDALHTSWLSVKEDMKTIQIYEQKASEKKELSELIDMLKQMDAKTLHKAKVIIKTAFFDE